MKKKSRGNGSAADLTVKILEKIQAELVGLRADNRGVRTEIVELREDTNRRFEALEVAMIRGFEGVTSRLENIRDFAGARYGT